MATTTRVLDELERLATKLNIDQDAAERLVSDVKSWDTLDSARRTEIQQLVESWSETAGKNLDQLELQLPDILGDSQTGTIIPELQQAFRRWKYRNPGKSFKDWLDYLASNPSRRQRVLVHAVLGSDFTRVVARAAQRSPKVTSKWSGLNWLVLRANPPSPGALAANAASLSGKVAEIMTQYAHKLSGDPTTQVARVEKLLARLVDSGNLAEMTEEGMKRILGSKSLHEDELVALLVQGLNWMEAEAASQARTVDELLDIEGIEYFFQDLLTRGGYQHGSRFEITCLAREIANGADAASMRLQVPMLDSRKGPDIVRYFASTAQLIQAKSFSDLSDLIRESTSAEIFEQLVKDLTRLGEHGFKVAANPPSNKTMALKKEIIFRVDLMQLQRKYDGSVDDLQEEALEEVEKMAEQVSHWLSLSSTKKQFGMDESDSPFQLVVEVL